MDSPTQTYQFDDLSPRERQVLSIVFQLESASVAEIHECCIAEVSYNAVRRILDSLTEKAMVTFRRDGRKYVYRPIHGKREQGVQQLERAVKTFFRGSSALAIASLLSTQDAAEREREIGKLRAWLSEQASPTYSRAQATYSEPEESPAPSGAVASLENVGAEAAKCDRP